MSIVCSHLNKEPSTKPMNKLPSKRSHVEMNVDVKESRTIYNKRRKESITGTSGYSKDKHDKLPANKQNPLSDNLKSPPAPYPFYYYTDRSRNPDDDEFTLLTPPGCSPNFLAKMHSILGNSEISDIVRWMPHGRSWIVPNPLEFESKVIPLFFEHNRFSSFIRLANQWGFRRVTNGPDRKSYYHEYFLRGLPHLCKNVKNFKGDKKMNISREYEPDFTKISEMYPLPDSKPPDEIMLQLDLKDGPQGRIPSNRDALIKMGFPPPLFTRKSQIQMQAKAQKSEKISPKPDVQNSNDVDASTYSTVPKQRQMHGNAIYSELDASRLKQDQNEMQNNNDNTKAPTRLTSPKQRRERADTDQSTSFANGMPLVDSSGRPSSAQEKQDYHTEIPDYLNLLQHDQFQISALDAAIRAADEQIRLRLAKRRSLMQCNSLQSSIFRPDMLTQSAVPNLSREAIMRQLMNSYGQDHGLLSAPTPNQNSNLSSMMAQSQLMDIVNSRNNLRRMPASSQISSRGHQDLLLNALGSSQISNTRHQELLGNALSLTANFDPLQASASSRRIPSPGLESRGILQLPNLPISNLQGIFGRTPAAFAGTALPSQVESQLSSLRQRSEDEFRFNPPF